MLTTAGTPTQKKAKATDIAEERQQLLQRIAQAEQMVSALRDMEQGCKQQK